LVVEVELLQAFAGREPGGADTSFTAVGFPGGDLALQAGGEELLIGPRLCAGALSETLDRRAQGWGLQRPGKESDLRADVAAGLGRH
jgi:hypothetical protein